MRFHNNTICAITSAGSPKPPQMQKGTLGARMELKHRNVRPFKEDTNNDISLLHIDYIFNHLLR